jgi:hypothetical protein
MRKKVIISAAVLLLIALNEINAQTSNVAYFMNLPQSHFFNPALKPATRFYIGLPVFSGISLGLQNNFLQVTDIFTPGLKADSVFSFQNPKFDLNRLASKLNKSNTLSAEANAQILGIGFPIGKNFSMIIDVSDRMTTKAMFPGSLLDLYMTGGAGLVDKTMNISDMNAKGQFFREYGVGFSGEIIHNLRIGAKVKLLSGIGSVTLDDRTFSLTVNNDLSQTVNASATLETAGREELSKLFNNNSSSGGVTGFMHDYIGIPLSNPGFSIDFGGVYNIRNLVSLSLSVKDLGFINWKSDLQAWNAEGTFTLPGITLKDVQNQTFSLENMFNSLVDSVQAHFKRVTSPQPFKTYLPTDIIAGASLNPVKFFSLGVLSVSRFYAGTLSETVTLSANTHFAQVFSASAAYSISNNSYNNLGIGLAVTAGFAQIYMIADKIPLTWEKVYFSKSGSSDFTAVPLPKNFNMINFQFGVNIVFGKQVSKKTDKPMLQSDDSTKQ